MNDFIVLFNDYDLPIYIKKSEIAAVECVEFVVINIFLKSGKVIVRPIPDCKQWSEKVLEAKKIVKKIIKEIAL